MILPLHDPGNALVHVFQVVYHNALCNVSKAEDLDLDRALQRLSTRLRRLLLNCQPALNLGLRQTQCCQIPLVAGAKMEAANAEIVVAKQMQSCILVKQQACML